MQWLNSLCMVQESILEFDDFRQALYSVLLKRDCASLLIVNTATGESSKNIQTLFWYLFDTVVKPPIFSLSNIFNVYRCSEVSRDKKKFFHMQMIFQNLSNCRCIETLISLKCLRQVFSLHQWCFSA